MLPPSVMASMTRLTWKYIRRGHGDCGCEQDDVHAPWLRKGDTEAGGLGQEESLWSKRGQQSMSYSCVTMGKDANQVHEDQRGALSTRLEPLH